MASKRKRGDTWEYTLKKKGLLHKPIYLRFHDEAEGDRYARNLQALLDKGIVPTEFQQRAGGLRTLKDAIIEYRRVNQVANADRDLLRTLERQVGDVVILSITYPWVEQWISGMKEVDRLAPQTIRNRAGALSRCLDWLVRHEHIPANPMKSLPVRYANYSDGARESLARDRPDIDTNVYIPDAPAIVMPEMGELEDIIIPDFVFPTLPVFDETPPDANGVQVPDVFINWKEPEYQSEVLGDLQGQVKRMMAGGTGLPPEVEDALFSRARERASAEITRAVQEATDTWAARNFSMPPGMLVKAANVAREEGQLKAAEINRDIMIEAAKWEIESIRFAVQQGMALEQLTQNLYTNMANRLFETAKFNAEAQISVFNARINLFNAQNDAFKTLADVYRVRLDAAISQLTAYKTAIEGQAAIGQINQQRVDVFKAKLDSVQSNVDVYKALMQGAQIRSDTIKTQFDAYRADVQAFAEQINAEKVKFDAYESRIKGEQAKAGVYDSQARAFASTIQGLASKADIQVKGAQIKMDAARTRVTKFVADVDSYKAQIQANLGEVQYATQAFTAQVEAWRAHAAANTADAEMQARFADMNSRTNIAYAEMQISEYTANMTSAVQQAQIALDAAKALGQYTAQLAAGAMSAAHVSASISGSGSASSSHSKSESTSTSHNYNY